MVASLWEPILAGALIFATLCLVGMAVASYLVVRFGRRKWRAFHAHGAVVGATALWQAASTAGHRRAGPGPTGDAHQWTSRRLRRELWRSVDQAEAAVRVATQAGAPTASLPGLCRRLHDVAEGLDRVLRVAPAGTAPGEIASQAAEVMQAASDVARAAVASAGDASSPQVQALVRDADHEIQCLDAGLASARMALRPTDS